MLAAPLGLRQEWLKDDTIYWVLNTPKLKNGIVDKLPRELKDRYAALMNSLK